MMAWLIYSPKRLAVVAVAVLLLGGVAWWAMTRDSAPTTSAPAPAPVATATDPRMDLAVKFVRAWAVHDPADSQAVWASTWHDYVTPDLYGAMSLADSYKLPGGPPAGSPTYRFQSETSAQIAVPIAMKPRQAWPNSVVLVTVVGAGSQAVVEDVQPDVGD